MKNLKRMDLVDQFEALTLQEIKKHNEAVLESNMAINSLRIEQDRIAINFDELTKELENKLQKSKQSVDVTLNILKKEVEQRAKYTDKLVSQYSGIVRLIENDLSQIEYKYVTKDQWNVFQKKIEGSLESLETKLKNTREILFAKFDAFTKELRTEVQAYIRSHEEREDPFPALKDEILEILSVHKVDSEGITKKIHDYANDLFVMERKIEFLMKEIEKLKSKEN